jgi:hypothetical protein
MTIDIKLKDGRVVKMREPKIRDEILSEEETTPSRRAVLLIANLTNMTFDEVLDLPSPDFAVLDKGYKSFFE